MNADLKTTLHDTYVLRLESGGVLEMEIEVELSRLDATDREFLLDLIARFKKHAQETR